MVRIGGNRRRAAWRPVTVLAAVVIVALSACSGSDPVNVLKANHPQDAKAAAQCQGWNDGRGAKYTIGAKDATVAEVKAHIEKVLGDSALGRSGLSLLEGRSDDEYVALCLLKTPDGVQLDPTLPVAPGPMTLALLADGASLWADTGPQP